MPALASAARRQVPLLLALLLAGGIVACSKGGAATEEGGAAVSPPAETAAAETPVVDATSAITTSASVSDTLGSESAADAAPTADPTQTYLAHNFEFPVLGDPGATLMIYEFSDYRCPFCRRFATETLPKLQAEYIDNGGPVAVSFIDFPLQAHGYPAIVAAEAAHCAAEQGSYWDMHSAIYGHFSEMNDLPLEEWEPAIDYVVNLGGDLGLDTAALRQCVEDKWYLPTIGAEYQQALDADVSVTPTIVVGQRLVLGFMEWEKLKPIVDEQIAVALGTPVTPLPTPEGTPEASDEG